MRLDNKKWKTSISIRLRETFYSLIRSFYRPWNMERNDEYNQDCIKMYTHTIDIKQLKLKTCPGMPNYWREWQINFYNKILKLLFGHFTKKLYIRILITLFSLTLEKWWTERTHLDFVCLTTLVFLVRSNVSIFLEKT